MNKPRRIGTLLVGIAGAFLIASCGGGGGNSGPTAPPPPAIPTIAGSWTGAWVVPGISFPLTPQFVIAQSGASTTGSITVLGSTLQTTGTVGTDFTFHWQVVNGGCGSFSGNNTFGGLAPLAMNGTATLDTRGCSTSGFFAGPVAWSKTGAREKTFPGRAGDLGDVVRAIRAKSQQ